MINNKISSSDLVKITFFVILQIPLIFPILWGIIPSIILVIGFFISKRDAKIEVFKKTINLCKLYVSLTSIIIILVTIYVFITDEYYRDDPFTYIVLPMLLCFFGLFLYLLALEFLLCRPLINNSYFIFSPERKNQLNILGSEKMKSYSIADELLKWKELKDKGLISEKEFEEMKKKIIGS
ncbi:SHOCT domain-containing protein [Acinetobacter soli]|uniref:SHOCT domain-containing protein n=1 Tax=Acinetobacter soli TaxID=487316 RepID=A0A1P8EG15_9GAMM|nr:SHOCT domain-containing protein [Acinetobacter soli]APV35149.1 hypothetical protein BEN76_03580 [Acinetobacter soli]